MNRYSKFIVNRILVILAAGLLVFFVLFFIDGVGTGKLNSLGFKNTTYTETQSAIIDETEVPLGVEEVVEEMTSEATARGASLSAAYWDIDSAYIGVFLIILISITITVIYAIFIRPQ